MPSFADALVKVHLQEGGAAFTNFKTDKGGPTRWGVTQGAFDKWKSRKLGRPYKSTIDEIKNMSKADSIAIYKEDYWDKISGDKIKSFPVAYAIFDQAVNGGPETIVQMTQRLLGIADDGIAGKNFITAVNKVPEKEFLAKFIPAAKLRYETVVKNNAAQAVNLNGWMNRLKKVQDYVTLHAGTKVVVASSIGLIVVLSLAGYFLIVKPTLANSSKAKVYG
jgi:lysozyme family protein